MDVRNGPAYFQHWMDAILNQLPKSDRQFIQALQDDVFILADPAPACQCRFQQLIAHLRAHIVVINESKWTQPTDGLTNILGFQISRLGVAPFPAYWQRTRTAVETLLNTACNLPNANEPKLEAYSTISAELVFS